MRKRFHIFKVDGVYWVRMWTSRGGRWICPASVWVHYLAQGTAKIQ